MTAMVKVSVPSQAVPSAAFFPLQKGLANEEHKFSPMKGLSHRLTLLSAAPLLIQPKLALGETDDKYEREADRVAEMVMRMPSPVIQRKGT
jgi:hypothetical protein